MKKINNKFFDIVLFVFSLFFSFFRSIVALFKKDTTIKKSSFFDSIDYFFRLWPSYFWKKPNLFKIGVMFGSFIKYIFYKK